MAQHCVCRIQIQIGYVGGVKTDTCSPEDVPKTAFAMIFGTFVSLVMQQGDCNAPSTFQRLMTAVVRDYIARFVHVYLDDIFIYSLSIEEHEKHLGLVFNKLHEAQLYLSRDRVDLYSQRMDCLSHIISDGPRR